MNTVIYLINQSCCCFLVAALYREISVRTVVLVLEPIVIIIGITDWLKYPITFYYVLAFLHSDSCRVRLSVFAVEQHYEIGCHAIYVMLFIDSFTHNKISCS